MGDQGAQRLVLRLRLANAPRIEPGPPLATPEPSPPPPPAAPAAPAPPPPPAAPPPPAPPPSPAPQARPRPLVAERAAAASPPPAPSPPVPPRQRPLVAPRPGGPSFLPSFDEQPLPPRPVAPAPSVPPAAAPPAPSPEPAAIETEPEPAPAIDPDRPAAAALLEAIRSLPPAPPCTLLPVIDVRADVARFRIETIDGVAGELVVEPNVDGDGWQAALDAAADPFFSELYEPVDHLGDDAAWAPLSHTLRVRLGERRMTVDLDIAFGTDATAEHLELAIAAAREALRLLG